MAHLSLYRAFRPDTFDKMVRQEHVVRILKNQITGDAVGHAYLFCGPRGTGKTSVARIFARAVNCERPVDGSPCGECATCRALADGSLDVSEIDAASNNGVNEMRDLREKVQYPPVSGKYKVYIIDEVHMLTDSAFNALLKTLEEPPRHAIFILATTEPQKIPATILSRCMRLDFKLIPEEDLRAHLKRILDGIGKPYEEEAVAAIARAGAGSDRDMLSIAEMCLAYSDKLTYEGVTAVLGAADFGDMCDLVRSVLNADTARALELTEKRLSEGKSVGVLLRDLLQFLNRTAIVATCKTAEKLLNLPKREYAAIAEIAASADGRAILRATEIFAATESTLRFVSSPRICLETAIVKAATPAADYNIDALLSRVSALERRLSALSSEGKRVATEDGGRAEPAARTPLPPERTGDESGEFPTEEPVFEEAYFSDGVPSEPFRADAENSAPEPSVARRGFAGETQSRRESAGASAPSSAEKSASRASSEGKNAVAATVSEERTVAPSAAGQTAEEAFGKFMRTLRKTSRNGVLFTMCSDLEARFEGDLLALYTESETVYRSLGREDHRAAMREAFSSVGVSSFEVRLKGAKKEDGKKGLDQLRRDFSAYEIEVR